MRRGIRALHVADRCEEELVRLDIEEESLYLWIIREIRALDAALADTASAHVNQSAYLSDAFQMLITPGGSVTS